MARKILLADDSVTAQNMGRKILADAGYEVITVNNGSAALKKIAELKPDLIVLDVYMPGYSGLEVCQRLKEAAETARIPVLLTVGKLEPFKPEEAKRVRAEGFIVKPFEASELLSALSKLEDKIVPRSEPSKPGRFARAMAAVEESGREPVEEESGWKSRIGFPSKKKKKDDESGEVAAPAAAKPVETAPVAELPKDVTPEEMAALAAAAAQVQAAAQSQSAANEIPVSNNVENAAPSASVDEVRHDRRKSDARVEQAQLEQAKLEVAKVEAAKLESEKLEAEKLEAQKNEAQKNEAQKNDEASAPAATFAEHKVEEKGDAAESPSAPGNHAEVIAALASLEPTNGQSWDQSHSGNGHGTLADAAAVSSVSVVPSFAGTSARWTAVPAALDPAESAISLELEMQKAYAAFAAAEANQPGFVSPVSSQTSESAAPLESDSRVAVEEPVPAVQNQTPELAQVAEPVASAPAESPVSETVSNEMSVVAPSYTEPQTEYPAQPDAASAPANETSAQLEAPIQIPEPAPVPEIAELVQAVEARIAAETQPVADVVAPETAPEQIAPPVSEPVAAEPAVAAAPEEIPAAQVQPAAVEGVPDESNIHAATAAAWANWRQIRESGSSRPEETSQQRNSESSSSSSSSDEAAMAVAAGAETSPDASALPEPDHIASMVESVLAGLRPKIAAEISKKLGEKK